LRKNFRGLEGIDDSILANASLTDFTVMSRHKAGGGAGGGSKLLSKAMAATYEELAATATKVAAGEDDCTGVAHSSRFLRGYVGDSVGLWQQGRNAVGIEGLDPISHYDTVNVGLGGLISNKGWAEAHNPGSKQLSIRLFTPAALQAGWNASDRADTTKEFDTVLELRTALAALEGAIHKIYPWNWSVKTILLFLTSIDFGEIELAGRSDRLSILADFIDGALATNAQSWDEKKGFLTHENLCARWTALNIRLKAGGGGGRKTTKKARASKGAGSGGERGGSRRIGRPSRSPGACAGTTTWGAAPRRPNSTWQNSTQN